MKKGLILEGGGMRGIYTAGVLDFFLEHDICFDEVVGVSAGACHGCSYLSKQMGRAYDISTQYLNDKRYCSINSLLKTGNMFGKEFVYHEIPEKLNVFDHLTYGSNPTKLTAVVTNVKTGKAEYHELIDLNTQIDTLRASASLPFLSELVTINNDYYLDGGVSDSIPLDYMLGRGCDKIVLVLTQPKGYRKSKNKLGFLAGIKYRKYPKLVESIRSRHIVYNRVMDKIDELEKQGKILVIRPSTKLNIDRIEKDINKLEKAYAIGYVDCKEKYEGIVDMFKEY